MQAERGAAMTQYLSNNAAALLLTFQERARFIRF